MSSEPKPEGGASQPCAWELRYQTGDMPWEKGAPSPGLVDFLARRKPPAPATVVIPGCGTGHDVRAWAEHGFEALGLDLAPSAIELARAKSGHGPARPRYQHGDFLRDPVVEPRDWMFEHTLFCAIHPTERPLYVEAARRWLKPFGRLLAVFYLIPDEDGPPFGTTREEVKRHFGDAFRLEDDWVPPSYPNREGLEWMTLWTRL